MAVLDFSKYAEQVQQGVLLEFGWDLSHKECVHLCAWYIPQAYHTDK